MNEEIIERLLIDKASGELPADASALLDAWLAREPDARAQARQIDDTLRLAKLALAGPAETALLRPRFQPPAWFRRAALMAACFAAGLGLGLFLLRQPALAPPAASFAAASDAGFWSSSRLRASSSITGAPGAKFSAQGARLIWKSPVTRPQTETSS
jgi:anti-sigma factor RsiW